MCSKGPWPDSTFDWESEDQEHYCGSHWDALYDSPDEVLRSLPKILPDATPLVSYGDTYPGPHKIPEAWTRGVHLAWPDANRGLVATLAMKDGRPSWIDTAPLAGNGVQVSIRIETVHVWSNGAEAQIEGGWGDALVSFFDLTFLSNRSWYEAGQHRDFILAGIAYKAEPASVDPLILLPESELADQIQDHMEIDHSEALELGMERSCILAHIEEWDRDDYWFRGPVRVVESFDDWLGQSGWRVRVCVMQLDTDAGEPKDAELDVFITSRAWFGQDPPEVDEDIEGTLWLQGRLWSSG